MRRLGKVLKWVVILNVVAYAAARIAKHYFPSQGDPGSAHFDLVTIFEGLEFASVSQELEGGSAVVVCGGVDMDLTEAHLCEEGARLSLLTVCGGIRLMVPDEWRVDVTGSAFMGGADTQFTPATSLPDDAPTLTVDAQTYMGGVQIISRA